ncbi:MAG TPA: hypothetical protein VM686_23790 [Polyangiaceae bacterium]|nr:hypothetical protein [Polyangiaceae bacterium]
MELRRGVEGGAKSTEPHTQAKVFEEHAAHEAQHDPERSPAAVLKGLTHPGVVFAVDYPLTDAYQRASESCNAEAGESEAKRAECLGKVRERFTADVIRFREDDDGRLWWVTYKRKGEELLETHSTRVELDVSTPLRVTMTTVGHGKGKRQLFKGLTKVEFGVPNEYSIEIQDPDLGRLVYDAKVGFAR